MCVYVAHVWCVQWPKHGTLRGLGVASLCSPTWGHLRLKRCLRWGRPSSVMCLKWGQISVQSDIRSVGQAVCRAIGGSGGQAGGRVVGSTYSARLKL